MDRNGKVLFGFGALVWCGCVASVGALGYIAYLVILALKKYVGA